MRTLHNYTIAYSDVDAKRHIRLCDLERYILETAGASATRMGLGTEYVYEHYQTAWVLTRLSVEMDYLPSYEDQIQIETWIEGNRHMFSLRNFHIYLMKGEDRFLIGRAASIWTLLNLETRQVDMRAYQDSVWENVVDGTPVEMAKAPRLGRIAEPTSTLPHTIHYTDIDFNNHCNSAAYMRFFLNADPRLTTCYPVRFDINYVKEVQFGEKTEVQVEDLKDEAGALTALKYCLLTEEGEISATCQITRM